jgi:hypothetical protein
MELNTYQSRTSPDVYVTMPTVEAAAIIALVDGLAPLSLTPVRCGYRLSGEARDRAFLEKITLEIAAIGYAVHRFDSALQRWHGGTMLNPAAAPDPLNPRR